MSDSSTKTVTDDSFSDDVLSSGTPVLVDFWATWCGPCKTLGPQLEAEVARHKGRVRMAKVNVDENPEQAAALGVRGIPALFMFKGGEVVSNRMGAAPKAALKNWIDESI